MNKTILFVDDDPTLLTSLQRLFHKQFEVTTAAGPVEGVQRLAEADFAVVVSDFRMPGMNGVDFLAEVRKRSADSTRILLTGYADLQTAINAVNESHIFRLLTKPISRSNMTTALQAGIEQHRLVCAERDLLSKTLIGSVKILLDLMEKVSPATVKRAARLKLLVRGMARRLHLANAWQFELAAMLSQIGYLMAPATLLDKYYQGQELSAAESQLLARYTEEGHDLLKNVPRLEQVAEILGKQQWVFTSKITSFELEHKDVVTLGALLLQTATEYENRRSRKQNREQAIKSMRFSGLYDTRLIHALELETAEEER